MTSLQEKLAASAARRAAEAAIQNPPAQAGMDAVISSPDTPVAGDANAQADKPEEKEKIFPTKADKLPEYSKDACFAGRQKYLILANGKKIMPDKFNVFEPASEEEKKLLEYYSSRNMGFVTRVHAEES